MKIQTPYHLPDWGLSVKKHKAREDTIIKVYRHITGNSSLPPNTQHISMAGQTINEDGTPRLHSEYYHLLGAGFLKSYQFIGIEKNPDWHILNSTIKDGSLWLHGDFYTTLAGLTNRPDFKPAIINVDNILFPATGASNYLAMVLALLTELDIRDVLVVGNMMLSGYCHHHPYTDIPRTLFENRLFLGIKDKWHLHDVIYLYDGANDDTKATKMGTTLLWR